MQFTVLMSFWKPEKSPTRSGVYLEQCSSWSNSVFLFLGGNLLTQILGGVWADKLGGKLILGFGAIWWSVAIVLTPVAARIGLPFLLTMRAFPIYTLPCCSHPFFHTYQARFYHSTSTHPTNPYPCFSHHLPSLMPLITPYFVTHPIN